MDEGVYMAERRDCLIDDGSGGVRRSEFGGYCLKVGTVEIVRRYRAGRSCDDCSGVQERLRNERTEAALCTGNDDYFVLEHDYSPDDHATRNSGYSVSPPQAKMVCPVMYDASS